MAQIYLDFEVAVEKFKGVPYDILDVAAKQVCSCLIVRSYGVCTS